MGLEHKFGSCGGGYNKSWTWQIEEHDLRGISSAIAERQRMEGAVWGAAVEEVQVAD